MMKSTAYTQCLHCSHLYKLFFMNENSSKAILNQTIEKENN